MRERACECSCGLLAPVRAPYPAFLSLSLSPNLIARRLAYFSIPTHSHASSTRNRIDRTHISDAHHLFSSALARLGRAGSATAAATTALDLLLLLRGEALLLGRGATTAPATTAAATCTTVATCTTARSISRRRRGTLLLLRRPCRLLLFLLLLGGEVMGAGRLVPVVSAFGICCDELRLVPVYVGWGGVGWRSVSRDQRERTQREKQRDSAPITH